VDPVRLGVAGHLIARDVFGSHYVMPIWDVLSDIQRATGASEVYLAGDPSRTSQQNPPTAHSMRGSDSGFGLGPAIRTGYDVSRDRPMGPSFEGPSPITIDPRMRTLTASADREYGFEEQSNQTRPETTQGQQASFFFSERYRLESLENDRHNLAARDRPDKETGTPARDRMSISPSMQVDRTKAELEESTPTRFRTTKYNEYFVPGGGIDREVIQHEICRYLGNDATVRPYTKDGRSGYLVRAYRALTSAMLDDLKENSARWRKDQDRRAMQGRYSMPYASFADDYGRDPIKDDTLMDMDDYYPYYVPSYHPEYSSSDPRSVQPPSPRDHSRLPVSSGYATDAMYAGSMFSSPTSVLYGRYRNSGSQDAQYRSSTPPTTASTSSMAFARSSAPSGSAGYAATAFAPGKAGYRPEMDRSPHT
jgi:hypothetical protein